MPRSYRFSPRNPSLSSPPPWPPSAASSGSAKSKSAATARAAARSGRAFVERNRMGGTPVLWSAGVPPASWFCAGGTPALQKPPSRDQREQQAQHQSDDPGPFDQAGENEHRP